MDNNAKSQAGGSPFDTIPKTQPISDQYGTPQQTQQGNQGISAGAFEDFLKQSTANQKSPLAPSGTPQQQPQAQAPASSQSEQIPAAQVMDDDDKDDRVQIIEQKTEPTETPLPAAQSSHPEILIKKELSEIVKPGPDADQKDLPEEPERLGDTLQENQVQQPAADKDKDSLPMTYGEAMLAKRKERSTKKGISWIIRETIREWKKRFIKTKQQEVKQTTI